MQPIFLAPNQPDLFYRGGESIARFRGLPLTGTHQPEDWLGSTTAIFGTESGAKRFARWQDLGAGHCCRPAVVPWAGPRRGPWDRPGVAREAAGCRRAATGASAPAPRIRRCNIWAARTARLKPGS